MKNKIAIISMCALGLSLVLQTGCETGAYPPKNTRQFDIENREPFVLLDKAAQNSVTCSGIQQRTLEDGRLEVTANVRNRIHKRIQVQINCVFKDEQGFSTGDETPWINLILDENAQESVKFVSMNDKAKKFTIRVRQAR
ncbi:MAG: YcfL family protein [Verrucomicrobiia bacterium]